MKTLLTITLLLAAFTAQAKVSITAIVTHSTVSIIHTQIDIESCENIKDIALNHKFLVSKDYETIVKRTTNEAMLVDNYNTPINFTKIEPTEFWDGMLLIDTPESSLAGFVNPETTENVSLECKVISPKLSETLNEKFTKFKEYLWKL
jgi:hypothetical protein